MAEVTRADVLQAALALNEDMAELHRKTAHVLATARRLRRDLAAMADERRDLRRRLGLDFQEVPA